MLTPTLDPRSALISELISAATHFYNQGWMLGTAGNLSARTPEGSFWITASGRPKGNLSPEDFVCLTVEGEILDRGHHHHKPSAETAIHQAIYRLYPEAQACYHVHSVAANLVSNFTDEDDILLPPLEMIKGLGVWDEQPICRLPLFANQADVPAIGLEIEQRFAAGGPPIPALLIRNHGVTVWGKSPIEAFHHIELIEYIFRYMVQARALGLATPNASKPNTSKPNASKP
jgi:methylthioribulose-1-phosphate dehydratase